MNREFKYKGKTAEKILAGWRVEYNVEPDLAQRIDPGFLDGITLRNGTKTKGVRAILEPETPEKFREELLDLAKTCYFATVDVFRETQKELLENSLVN